MAFTTHPKPRSEPDIYMKLVPEFPLRPIKNDQEHRRAVDVIGKLMGHDLDPGAGDYLDTLILLVNKYQDEHHTPEGAHLTPR